MNEAAKIQKPLERERSRVCTRESGKAQSNEASLRRGERERRWHNGVDPRGQAAI